jgi:hypothetical protein
MKNIPVGWPDSTKRQVVIHYHFFKNAGTSIDQAFRQIFEERWIEVEVTQPRDLSDFIEKHPGHVVFSSHSALFPVPQIAGTAIFPIVFIRHPLDRIQSIYKFERQQQPISTKGSRMAKELDLRGYVAWRLEVDHLIKNFHVTRFSSGLRQRPSLNAALAYVDTLPFVGVVEYFSHSLKRLESYLQLAFPGTQLVEKKANVTRKEGTTLDQRIAELKELLGQFLFDEVLRNNEDDLKLYEHFVDCLNPQTDESEA